MFLNKKGKTAPWGNIHAVKTLGPVGGKKETSWANKRKGRNDASAPPRPWRDKNYGSMSTKAAVRPCMGPCNYRGAGWLVGWFDCWRV